MLTIQATDQQLMAIGNKIMMAGTIEDITKTHGFTTTKINYEGRIIDVVQNRIDGYLVTVFIEDVTLQQMFCRKANS